jgi:hypothetical protein
MVGPILFLVLVGLFLWWGWSRRRWLEAGEADRLLSLAAACRGEVGPNGVHGTWAGRPVWGRREESTWRTAMAVPDGRPFRISWRPVSPDGKGRLALGLAESDAGAELADLVRMAELEPVLGDPHTWVAWEDGLLMMGERLPGGLPTPERFLSHLDLLERTALVVGGRA